MKINKNLQEKLNGCIAQSDKSDSIASHIFQDCTVNETKDILSHLIQVYLDAPELLEKFWQSKSDACPLEASEMEANETEFKKWFYSEYLNL